MEKIPRYYTYFSIEFGKSSYIKRGSICNVLHIQADMIDGIQYGGRPKQNHITWVCTYLLLSKVHHTMSELILIILKSKKSFDNSEFLFRHWTTLFPKFIRPLVQMVKTLCTFSSCQYQLGHSVMRKVLKYHLPSFCAYITCQEV